MTLLFFVLACACRGETVAEPPSDAEPADSASTDTAAIDSAVIGADAADTSVADTSAADTSVADATATEAAGADTTGADIVVPDVAPSDAWPAGSTVTSTGCGTFPGPKMVRLEASTPFCIDTTEVTNAQYDLFLASPKPSVPAYCFTPSYGSPESSVYGPNKPRGNVTWCAAYAYCAWAGKRLCGRIGGGRSSVVTYTSTSESQWSYACRQGSLSSTYPYGNTKSTTACVTSGGTPADVASKAACVGAVAPFNQIFDLSGNVGEWEDACDRYEDVTGPDGRICKVRGGWVGADRYDCDEPQESTVLYKALDLGFRCCVDR